MGKWYILNEDHTTQAVSVNDYILWDQIYGKTIKIVGKDKIKDCEVSTVFLGLDHNHGEGEPILFETMIFGGERDQDQWRYKTWEEAVKGHSNVVKQCGGKMKQKIEIEKEDPITSRFEILDL